MAATDRIIKGLVPEWIKHQQEKAADYNGSGIENADILGIKGQFADIWRKIWKLKKAFWDGQVLINEQPREILLDLIGHCFLAIDMLDRQDEYQEESERRPRNAFNPDIREAADEAVSGDPSRLENMGMFLSDAREESSDPCKFCNGSHTYIENCLYRINRRRKR